MRRGCGVETSKGEAIDAIAATCVAGAKGAQGRSGQGLRALVCSGIKTPPRPTHTPVNMRAALFLATAALGGGQREVKMAR